MHVVTTRKVADLVVAMGDGSPIGGHAARLNSGGHAEAVLLKAACSRGAISLGLESRARLALTVTRASLRRNGIRRRRGP